MQNEELQRLRECPFCGGEAKLVDNSGEAYYWNKMTEIPGRVFLRQEKMPFGTRGVRNYYIFMVTDFEVHCTTKACFAKSNNIHFRSKEEAIKAWNRRAEDGK